MRALFHTVNNMGLGHLRRTGAIVSYLRQRSPALQPLVVTNAEFPRFMESVPVPAVILPHPRNAPSKKVDRLDATVSFPMFQSLALGVMQAYLPHLTVFDTYVGSQIAVKHRKLTDRSCLVFRKCRENTVWQYVRQGIFSQFDLVLIPHTHDEFYEGMPSDLIDAMEGQTELLFTGPIVFPESDPACNDELPRLLDSLAHCTVILVTSGGGGYDAIQSEFFDTMICAIGRFAQNHDRPVAVLRVLGPFASHVAPIDSVIDIRESLNVQYLMRRSDIVVSHGGYNSVNEVRACGARAIFTAFYRKTENQLERLVALNSRPGTMVVSNESSVAELAYALTELSRMPCPDREWFEGGVRAAEALTKLLTGIGRSRHGEYLSNTDHVEIPYESLYDCDTQLKTNPVKITVHLGAVEPTVLRSRIDNVLTYFEQLGFDPKAISFLFEEDTALERLVALASQLRGYTFDRLIGQLPEDATAGPDRIFAVLEQCRALRTAFDYDLTVRRSA